MKIQIKAFSRSKDFADVMLQLLEAFGNELTRQAHELETFENFSLLIFSPTTSHPVLGENDKHSRSFDKASDTYFVSVPVPYPLLVSSDWATRVNALKVALSEAVDRIPKTKLTPKEREALVKLIAGTGDSVALNQPKKLASANPIFLAMDQNGKVTSVAFELTPFNTTEELIEIPPEQAMKYAEMACWNDNTAPQMFKLYRKIDGTLHYHEAWHHDGTVFEHFGAVGEIGETNERPVQSEDAAEVLILEIKKRAIDDGFTSISPSRHSTSVVEFEIDEFGNKVDLDKRHQLEDSLNEFFGWLGLGHCDGGSIGSGTMEIFLQVVDFNIAKSVLERKLPAGSFQRIYRQ